MGGRGTLYNTSARTDKLHLRLAFTRLSCFTRQCYMRYTGYLVFISSDIIRYFVAVLISDTIYTISYFVNHEKKNICERERRRDNILKNGNDLSFKV